MKKIRFRNLLHQVLCIVYPNRCIFCGELIAPEAHHCAECQKKLVRCRQNDKLYEIQPIEYCDAVWSVYRYRTFSKMAIFRLKFYHDKSVARSIAKEICQIVTNHCAEEFLLPRDAFDLMMAVPMYPSHVRKRGYNQSVLLAQQMAKEMKISYNGHCLYKIRDTKKQHDISFVEKQNNLMDAFYVPNPATVKGKRILLIDDVSTSGNTFLQCAKTLKEAGAKSVYCVSFLSQSRNHAAYYLADWKPGKYQIRKST